MSGPESKVEAKIMQHLKKVGHFFKVMKSSRRGTHDRVGCVPVVITQDMVGMTFGRYCQIEVKKPKGGVKGDLQEYHHEKVLSLGGISGFAKSVADVEELLKSDMAPKIADR